MTPQHPAQPILGIALKVASTLVFTAMATLIKLASAGYPVGELVFFRSAFALAPVFVWVAWRDHALRAVMDVFRTKRIGSHVVRSAAGGTGMFLGFAALSMLPIADATAIGYASPLLTVAFAAVLLGEKVHVFRWTAVAVGLCGVLIMLTDFVGPEVSGHERSLAGAVVAIAAAIVGALAATYTRSLTRYESAATIVVYFSGLTAFIGLCALPLGWLWPGAAWSMPTAEDAVFLVTAGICGGVAQVFLTQSYRFGDASTIAPFDYTSMIWVLIVSLVVFGSWPSGTILFGTAIVIAAGLFVIWRERRLGIERTRSKRAQTPTTPLS
jgi:drug/metabolite transporter (DMT)-like permease